MVLVGRFNSRILSSIWGVKAFAMSRKWESCVWAYLFMTASRKRIRSWISGDEFLYIRGDTLRAGTQFVADYEFIVCFFRVNLDFVEIIWKKMGLQLICILRMKKSRIKEKEKKKIELISFDVWLWKRWHRKWFMFCIDCTHFKEKIK